LRILQPLVPFWENTLRKRGFQIAPLQSAWVVEKLKVSQQELAADLRRLLLTSGEQYVEQRFIDI
jgi:hypothetical protein